MTAADKNGGIMTNAPTPRTEDISFRLIRRGIDDYRNAKGMTLGDGKIRVQIDHVERVMAIANLLRADLAAKTREVAEVTEQRDAAANACERESLAKLQAQSRAEQAERELAEAKAQAEALARSVMTDTVSNDDALRVFRVTFPHGEIVYFGEESAAQACARTTGIVESVALARRNFSVVPTDRFEKVQTTMAKLVDKYTGTPCEQIKSANEYMEISEDRDHWKAEAERLREDAERYRRLFQWVANELLSCDYGENDGVELVGKPQIGWRVHGWRFKENNFKIYGESIEIAVQNQIEDAAPSARG